MQRGLILSVLLHTMVVLAFAIGLPFANEPRAQRVMEVPVEVANIADITNPPKGNLKAKAKEPKPEQKASKAKTAKPAAKPKPAPKPKAATPPPAKKQPDKKQIATRMEPDRPVPAPPKKAPPKQEPPKKAEPKKTEPDKPKIAARPTLRPKRVVKKAEAPKPKPVEKPKKQPVKKAAAPKNDAPKEKAKKTPKKEPKKVAEKKVTKKPAKSAEKPKQKPKPKKKRKVVKRQVRKPVKKVAKAKPKKPREVASRPAKKRPAPRRRNRMDDIYSFLNKDKGKQRTQRRAQRAQERQGARSHNASLPLSVSERMAIARQIKPCWRFPVGAKDEGSLRVEIRVWMGRDGRPVRHQVLDRARYARDSFFRAAADAGIRAIYNPRCLPIRLPARKYETWRVMILDFDPAKVSKGAL